MAYIGTSPSNGVRRRFVYEATANQTSFSGNDESGITLTYVDSLYLDVYQNGVKLKAGDDYTATTGTTVVLAVGATADDVVEMVSFDVFSVNDSVSASAGGSFAGNIGMGGTLAVTGAATVTGVVTANGGAVFNEGSADVDFRVESNGDANMLFVNGGSDAVGIGTVNVPSNKNTVTPVLNVSGSGVKGSAQITRHTSVGGGGALLHLAGTRGTDVNSYTILQDGDGIGTIAFQAADGNEFVTAAQISAKVDGTPGDNDMPGELTFSCTKDGASSVSEYFRLKSNGRLEAQSVSNDGNVLQQFRIDWRNENNAGIMAGIGCVRTDNSNAPGAFVIRTSTNVDSSTSNSDGEISEKFRVAANGDLTGTDTSIASNSDNRLKENSIKLR